MDSSGRQRQFQIQLKRIALQLVFPEVKREAFLAEFCRALAAESEPATVGVPEGESSRLEVVLFPTLPPRQQPS